MVPHTTFPLAVGVLLALLALTSCGGSEGTGGGGTSGTASADEALTCTVPELAQARSVNPLVIPGCGYDGSGLQNTPRVLHNAEELTAVLRCNGEGPPSASTLGVDFNANDVYVLAYTMSPAFGGIEVFDNGQQLTVLNRFRPNCPGDPMPMPMDSAIAWLMPKGAERSMQQASCSLPSSCD